MAAVVLTEPLLKPWPNYHGLDNLDMVDQLPTSIR